MAWSLPVSDGEAYASLILNSSDQLACRVCTEKGASLVLSCLLLFTNVTIRLVWSLRGHAWEVLRFKLLFSTKLRPPRYTSFWEFSLL